MAADRARRAAWPLGAPLALAAALLAGCGSPPPTVSAPQAALMAAQQAGGRALARGDHAGALAAYRQALAAAESVEDFDGTATARLNLAAVLLRQGQLAEAEAQLDALLARPQRYAPALLQQAAARKALAALDAGRAADALAWAGRAEAGCASPCAVAPAMGNLRAAVALAQGDATRAAALAGHAAGLAQAAGARAEQANAWRLQGRALTARGDTDAAAVVLARALDEDRALGLPDRIAADLMHAAENEERRQQVAAARGFYERALQVSRAAGLDAMAARAAARLAALGGTAPR
jgi:tetratricopeptide (TPR) repeat protein